MGALQTQVDALKKHAEDHERHIGVLRQQISAKDEHAGMIQADVSPWSSVILVRLSFKLILY